MKKFWNMKVNAADSSKGELLIYGDIVSDPPWWESDVTPLTFKEDMDALGQIGELHVYINSNGGDVFAGQAIHSMLRRKSESGCHVIVHVDGLAASIASVIAMAGDKVVMFRNSMMMVHRPWTFAYGNSEDMRKMADDLDKIGESLISAYEEKTGLYRDEISAIMDAETWLTADECKEKGFCDEVISEKKVAAALRGDVLAMNGQEFDLSRFRNRPQVDVVAELPTTEPIVEDEFIVPLADVPTKVLDSINEFLASGRVLSKENEDLIRNAYDGLGTVLQKLAKDEDAQDKDGEPDNDPDDAVPCDPDEDPNMEPDGPDDKCNPKKDALAELIAKVESLTNEVVAIKTSFSNAQPDTHNVGNPSSAKDEVVIALEEEHIINIVDEPAENEVNIEADTLAQSIKAAVDEKMAEFRLRNMGKVD